MFRSKDTSRDSQLEQSKVNNNPVSETHSQKITQLAQGSEVRGELKTPGSIVVDGRIEGTLTATGDVQINCTGSVEAEIEGKNITVAGQVKGKIFAEGKVILLSGSRVEGDIHAQSLKIEDSVFFQGGCVMGEGARKRRDDMPLPKSVKEISQKAA